MYSIKTFLGISERTNQKIYNSYNNSQLFDQINLPILSRDSALKFELKISY